MKQIVIFNLLSSPLYEPLKNFHSFSLSKKPVRPNILTHERLVPQEIIPPKNVAQKVEEPF